MSTGLISRFYDLPRDWNDRVGSSGRELLILLFFLGLEESGGLSCMLYIPSRLVAVALLHIVYTNYHMKVKYLNRNERCDDTCYSTISLWPSLTI